MHYSIIPSSNCNSICKYCYNRTASHTITEISFKEAISFINRLAKEQNSSKTYITFHGGEPLLAGYNFYNHAVPYIAEMLVNETFISMQSNLWLLDETLAFLFKQYNVGIGTSLDGPLNINDNQRGLGYFSKNISGIELLKKQGMPIGCITTFTKQSSEKLEEIFDFFVSKGLHFDVHAAIKPIDYPDDDNFFLTPEGFGELLIKLLDIYLENITKVKIGTLDILIKNVANKKSGLCTFSKCLGEYFAISPTGELYTCNRFVGNEDFCIGNIRDIHSFSDITKSEAWKKQQAWHDWIDEECKVCLYKDFCHGGCPYSAFASSNGKLVKDPLCEAYKMIYNYILDKGAAEFFSDENMELLSQTSNAGKTNSFQNSPVLYLMKDNPHPFDLVQTAKKIITTALLGQTNNAVTSAKKLYELGVIDSLEEKLPMIEAFHNELLQPLQGYNNLYLHITNHCNLSCSHCYAFDGNESIKTNLSHKIIRQLVKDATSMSFRKIIFTGGEPLMFPDFELLLDELQKLKRKTKLPILVLRTNLLSSLIPALIEKIKVVFDQIAVSIDGAEELHDKRRGKGAYLKTMNNLASFDAKYIEKKVSFACVLDQQLLSAKEFEDAKQQVNSIKSQYPVKEIRFLPLLPLGRAINTKTQRNKAERLGVSEWMNRKYHFRTSCGLGQSAMIESNGDVYPCHVLKETEKQVLGNVYEQSLQVITETPAFKKLREINVNTNNKCKQCEMRFLCGGVCKIWEDQDCTDLFERAKYLLNDALQICNISIEEFELINSTTLIND
jgi:uncharacterized protein